ncbi:hypothetical protein VT84_28730 [Gemmata sp. SH-PL17]|uniref:hypothetical protein n=1 Tax=Gemmata sp. SH-PL17 TaxID=1630693 RepID=UPI00078CA47D|nr:hypothetical protein [Gemmata sp. SH-PL17]AMV28424.1 hypothetical protein VT84_28730 [Gemmata sp. SH-PL17]
MRFLQTALTSSCAALVACLVLLTGTARADAPTPFLEGKHVVGAVETEPAVVFKFWSIYVVVVTSDTAEKYAIPATAKSGVVDPKHLGRSATVEAKILSWARREGRVPAVQLEILSVK